jgi:putative transposase
MTRLRGWAPKGERLVDKVPQGKWKTATFLAALRSDRIDAPCLFDGPINGERFRAYVDQFLVPTLKPGDVVILDNLGSHKGKAVRKAIRDVGARLVFLPKYSPDLNPIEQVFAKFKTLLRKVGARSYEAIADACGEILAQYPPAECAPYLKNADTRSSRFSRSPEDSVLQQNRRDCGRTGPPRSASCPPTAVSQPASIFRCLFAVSYGLRCSPSRIAPCRTRARFSDPL